MTAKSRLDFADFGSVQSLAENYDVECKLAAGQDGMGQFPIAALESYSAFANTEGGWIVLGVEEVDGSVVARGIEKPERVQKQFWDALNNRQQVSANILSNRDVQVVEQDGKRLVVVRVPAATRQQRPVYVGDHPLTGTYLRNFEGDYHASESTVKRMLAEVATEARDNEVLERYGLEDLDSESLAQFRNLFQSVSPGHAFLAGSDEQLLRSLGGMRLKRETGELELTVAGLLMFGSLPSIRERFPHFGLDFQEHRRGGERWVDRVTTDGSWAGNLFQFFRRVLPKLIADLKLPFDLDSDLKRSDTTPVHAAIREAFVNTLVHADFDASTPIRIVKRETSFEFRNPGRLRLPKDQVFDGGVSDCRNPAVQTMFQMIGAGEKAGSGFPTILRAWKEQHWRSPKLVQDIQIECTTLTLPFTSLLPPEAVAGLRASLGRRFDRLDQHERATLVTAWVEKTVTHERLMQVVNVHSRDLTLMLEKLVQEGFLRRHGRGRGCFYELETPRETESDSYQREPANPSRGTSPPSLQGSLPTLDSSSPTLDTSSPTLETGPPTLEASNGAVDAPVDEKLDEQLLRIAAPVRDAGKVARETMDETLVELCGHRPLTLNELAKLVGRKPKGLRDNYLSRLAREGRIRMRFPERVSHPRQAYISVRVEAVGDNNETKGVS